MPHAHRSKTTDLHITIHTFQPCIEHKWEGVQGMTWHFVSYNTFSYNSWRGYSCRNENSGIFFLHYKPVWLSFFCETLQLFIAECLKWKQDLQSTKKNYLQNTWKWMQIVLYGYFYGAFIISFMLFCTFMNVTVSSLPLVLNTDILTFIFINLNTKLYYINYPFTQIGHAPINQSYGSGLGNRIMCFDWWNMCKSTSANNTSSDKTMQIIFFIVWMI